jgi:hypothetical protein
VVYDVVTRARSVAVVSSSSGTAAGGVRCSSGVVSDAALPPSSLPAVLIAAAAACAGVHFCGAGLIPSGAARRGACGARRVRPSGHEVLRALSCGQRGAARAGGADRAPDAQQRRRKATPHGWLTAELLLLARLAGTGAAANAAATGLRMWRP